jgi:hypothetical protein
MGKMAYPALEDYFDSILVIPYRGKGMGRGGWPGGGNFIQDRLLIVSLISRNNHFLGIICFYFDFSFFIF